MGGAVCVYVHVHLRSCTSMCVHLGCCATGMVRSWNAGLWRHMSSFFKTNARRWLLDQRAPCSLPRTCSIHSTTYVHTLHAALSVDGCKSRGTHHRIHHRFQFCFHFLRPPGPDLLWQTLKVSLPPKRLALPTASAPPSSCRWWWTPLPNPPALS